MKNQKIAEKLIALASAGTILLTSAFSTNLMLVAKKAKNQKPYTQIVRDMESLDVDTGVADNFSAIF